MSSNPEGESSFLNAREIDALFARRASDQVIDEAWRMNGEYDRLHGLTYVLQEIAANLQPTNLNRQPTVAAVRDGGGLLLSPWTKDRLPYDSNAGWLPEGFLYVTVEYPEDPNNWHGVQVVAMTQDKGKAGAQIYRPQPLPEVRLQSIEGKVVIQNLRYPATTLMNFFNKTALVDPADLAHDYMKALSSLTMRDRPFVQHKNGIIHDTDLIHIEFLNQLQPPLSTVDMEAFQRKIEQRKLADLNNPREKIPFRIR